MAVYQQQPYAAQPLYQQGYQSVPTQQQPPYPQQVGYGAVYPNNYPELTEAHQPTQLQYITPHQYQEEESPGPRRWRYCFAGTFLAMCVALLIVAAIVVANTATGDIIACCVPASCDVTSSRLENFPPPTGVSPDGECLNFAGCPSATCQPQDPSSCKDTPIRALGMWVMILAGTLFVMGASVSYIVAVHNRGAVLGSGNCKQLTMLILVAFSFMSLALLILASVTASVTDGLYQGWGKHTSQCRRTGDALTRMTFFRDHSSVSKPAAGVIVISAFCGIPAVFLLLRALGAFLESCR